MRKAFKYIGIILLLILILIVFLWITDFGINLKLSENLFLTIYIIFFVCYLGLIIKKIWIKITVIIISLVLGFCILTLKLISEGIGGEENNKSWKIEKYEIQCVRRRAIAGPQEEQYIKLNKYFIGNIFYKTLDIKYFQSSYCFNDSPESCKIDFEKVGLSFDLCEKRIIK